MQGLLRERVTFILILLPLFLYPDRSNGQSENIDFLTWTDFSFTYTIKNRTNIGADMGVRGLVSKHDWNQFYFRPAFHYYFNSTLNAGGGVAIFATLGDVIKNVTEVRIHQEMGVAWPIFDKFEFFTGFVLRKDFLHIRKTINLIKVYQMIPRREPDIS